MGRYPEHGEKVCSACGQTKAFVAFYRRQNLTDGRMDVCIVCFQAEFPAKVCNTCHTAQPLDAFPVHPSSTDGHKYTCSTCLEQQRIQLQTDRVQYSIAERKRKADETNQRAEQNRLLKAYGYYWHKEESWDEWYEEYRETYVLYTPDREVIEVQAALQRIAQLQAPRYGHPSTLWARDMCALPNAIVLDTETTGFGQEAEIIDLGIISIGGKKLVDQLMQCQMLEIPTNATRVHHITKSMLDRANAPTFPQIWKRLMERLETYVIIIYNADFDRQMLEQTARRYNLLLPKLEIHCMMKSVAAYIGGSKKAYKLETACHHFHIENTSAHRAFADAQASQKVLQALAQMAVSPELEV
jgi:DNA polymerase-3 subunit epsilon